MRVRDFLEPATTLGDHATLADALPTLTGARPVFVRAGETWYQLTPQAAVGYPAARRLIDLPLSPVAILSADDEIAAVMETAGAGVFPVRDGDLVIGYVDRARLADAMAAAAEPEQLGEIVAAGLVPTLLHDLANSLTVAEAAMATVARDDDGDTLDAAALALRHAATLLHRVRSITAGEDEPAPRATDPIGVVAELEPLLRLAAGTGILLAVELTPGTPPVLTYRRTLERCLLNLVVNAREATGGVGRLRIQVGPAGAEVVIQVEDDGPGIPPQLATNLFELGSTTKRGHGRGLGLKAVARALQRVGGTIEAAAGELGGACFVIRLLPA